MRRKLILFVILFTVIASHAQQDAQYTQYMYNTININPAYAGSRGVLSVFGLYRTQWVGLDGAPKTGTLSVNTPINNSHVGVGVSLVSDKIGPTNENTLSADLSYSVQVSAESKISFGIKGSANLFNLDINKLNLADQGDPQFQDFSNKFNPNIGAGVYWHSDKAYVGLSVPNFIETNRYDDNDIVIYKDKINYYFMTGYVFNLDDYQYIKFKPAALVKMIQGVPLQVDVSANFMFNDKFVAGLAYRWNASLSAMAGFQVTDGLYIGYGYDRETTRLNNYNSGSHEIFLRYEFFSNKGKMITPRFF
ncbi:type IX secretion system membrane protein PorP/SprF [Flavobacterium sp. Fl-318]|uniref:Type IX secretion system membrane protein PorP/SprF n=1 Tax=Flavobacterium cupriresistens TaxID=2893885 RepID=A0ABU4RIZ5_9FLAO|nr:MULTISPECIES: type IX secretion system membrane protein PorP/SprF [unclassified Flavobacterium]MDX6191385.1 type IX secretion system membrane protein PorP/SprF [Flavobacterium sp. Fl-318]UFH43150.1 type IX secretion system membrane protein PorP/SprF [Flavobacterium sp. F-323]